MTTTADLETNAPRIAAVPRWERWTIGVLTAAFVALVAFWGVLTPFFDAPDEPQHLNSAIRLAEGGGWPAPNTATISEAVLALQQGDTAAADRLTFSALQAEHPGDSDSLDQMTQHPPLYYAYVAGVLQLLDYHDMRSDLVLTTARWAGLLFAAPLPLLAWASVRRLLRSPKAGIVAAASLFAVPQLAHILGSVSNDGLTIAAASVVVWLAIRIMTGDQRWLTTVGMGLALGVSILTKGTALPLIPFVAVVLLLWPRTSTASRRVVHALVALGVALIGGWWWMRNLFVYHALQPAGLVYPPKEWPADGGPDRTYFIGRVWDSMSNSFWGQFGWLSHPLPYVLTDTLTVVCVFVIVAFAYRVRTDRARAIVLSALVVVFVLAVVFQSWQTYTRSQLAAGLQGRYLFVVIVPLIALSALAWRNFFAPPRRRTGGVALLVSFAAVTVTGAWYELRLAYPDTGAWLSSTPVGAPVAIAMAVLVAMLCVAAIAIAIRFVLQSEAFPAPVERPARALAA